MSHAQSPLRETLRGKEEGFYGVKYTGMGFLQSGSSDGANEKLADEAGTLRGIKNVRAFGKLNSLPGKTSVKHRENTYPKVERRK